MRKIILLILSVVFIFGVVGCAEDSGEAKSEKTFRELLRTTNVNDISTEEAIYMTVQDIYNKPELSPEVKERVIKIFDTLQKGFYADDGETLLLGGMGGIRYPTMASAVFVQLYKQVYNSDNETVPVLKEMLSYDVLDNESLYNDVMGKLRAPASSMQDISLLANFISNCKKYIIDTDNDTQDNLVAVAEEYAKMLVDSESSASKTVGGGGVARTNEFYVTANIGYMLTDIAMKTETILSFDNEIFPERTEFIADVLYNLTDNTKLRQTYNKSPKEFKTSDAIEKIELPLMVEVAKNVLADISTTKEIPGRRPYPASYVPLTDEVDLIFDAIDPMQSDGYSQDSADRAIYTTIGNHLLGSPTGKKAYTSDVSFEILQPTARVNANMLYIYKKLKQHGLKAPIRTSEIGAKELAGIIAKFLTENGIVYLNANTDTADPSYILDFNDNILDNGSVKEYGPYQTNLVQYDVGGQKIRLYQLVNQIFSKSTSGSTPICGLIKKYNQAIDNAAENYKQNRGYYTMTASGGLCGINITDEERNDFGDKVE